MNYKEIEYKYWADSFSKEDLLARIEEASIRQKSQQLGETVYVVSCDDYYLRGDDSEQNFIRFRKGGGIYELTLKRKLKTNVIRKEVNLSVTDNEDSAIVEFLTLNGYKKSFQVYKEAWICHFNNCDISYYTLSDGRSVVELEAVNYSSLDEGVGFINDWEKSLGLSELTRECRSLYEIFTEEKASVRTSDEDPADE